MATIAPLDFAAIGVLCLAVVVCTYIVYRYYTQKLHYAYKTERLEYDELVVADGGHDETDTGAPPSSDDDGDGHGGD